MNEDIKILIADDDPDVLFATTRIIKSEGYQVKNASSGAECRALVKNYSPDIILLDVVFGDVNGAELCRELKSDPISKDIFNRKGRSFLRYDTVMKSSRMKKVRISCPRTLITILVAVLLAVLFQTDVSHGKTDPRLNNGKKWRIAYYEGGPYSNYQLTLISTIQGLVELGWIESVDFPKNIDESDNRRVWSYLSRDIKSKYIEFVSDGFLSAEWKLEKREAHKNKMTYRLSKIKDIDLIIAMGTWAGKDLVGNLHSTPTIVMSTTDPVRAKIINSPQDSGYDHVFARCDPRRHERQIRLFHEIVRFKKLGVILINSDQGRIHSAWKDVTEVGKKRNFEIIPCYIPGEVIEPNTSITQCLECLERIAPKVDALLLPFHNAFQAKYIHNYIPLLIKYKIPSWSIVQNPLLIRRGIMMSLSKKDFSGVGRFQAEAIAAIFNGSRPRDLNQIYEDIDTIAVNTKTAELINFEIPKSILKISDKLYDEIEKKGN